MLLAIDPGAESGWAIFDSCRRLASCGLYDGDRHVTRPVVDPGSRALIESPRLRPRGEKNPNAILTLARNAGEWGGRYEHCEVEYLAPNDWKGSLRKETSHARVWAKLDEKERGVVDAYFRGAPGRNGLAPSLRHNVLDAIGLGLHGVGR